MKTLIAVTYVSGVTTIVTYASEDGEIFLAPTRDWAQVAEPKRFVKDRKIATPQGKVDGGFGEWLFVNGVYEFWTESLEVAMAVAKTTRMAGAFIPSCR